MESRSDVELDWTVTGKEQYVGFRRDRTRRRMLRFVLKMVIFDPKRINFRENR